MCLRLMVVSCPTADLSTPDGLPAPGCAALRWCSSSRTESTRTRVSYSQLALVRRYFVQPNSDDSGELSECQGRALIVPSLCVFLLLPLSPFSVRC